MISRKGVNRSSRTTGRYKLSFEITTSSLSQRLVNVLQVNILCVTHHYCFVIVLYIVTQYQHFICRLFCSSMLIVYSDTDGR